MNFCKFLYDLKKSWTFYFLLMGFLVCFNTNAISAFEKMEAGALPNSMGNAIVALIGSPYAIYYNPAVLSDSIKIDIILSYQILYEIKDLSQADIIINFSIAKRPFSIALNQFGNGRYREIQVCMGSKYNITPVCAIGGSIQYYQLLIHHYGQQSTWGINLALYYNILPNLYLGALVTNINKPRISQKAEFLPQTMSMGLNYEPISALSVCFALIRDIHFSQDYRFGFSFQTLPNLSIRAGIEDQINTYNFGLGINTNWIVFDYALKLHPFLGASHIFTIRVIL